MAHPPGKRQTLLSYLERGIAMLHLDARAPGVVVPPEYASEPHLRLNLSYRFGIPDLQVGPHGVQATLSFHGRQFRCQLPWKAVFGITSQVNGEGQVWPEDLPRELTKAEAAEGPPKDALRPAAQRPVPVEAAPEQAEEEDPTEGSPSPPRRGHLRLVR